jgi:hypothetical protein
MEMIHGLPTNCHIGSIAGRYGLPMQIHLQRTPHPLGRRTEPRIKPVKKLHAARPLQNPVPRELWQEYTELRQQIRLLRSPYRAN